MPKERIRVPWWSSVAIAAGLIAGGVWAQPPDASPDAPRACNRRGPLHRLLHHSAHTIHDKFIGYPDTFIEPPLGYYVNEQFALQTAKADPHRFTLYKSDFLPGTNFFSPAGASRFNLMFCRLPGWLGPITVEWTPDEPGLAESRRQAVLETLERAGQTLVPERVVIGPSPYPGAMGIEAVNDFNNLINRSQAAAPAYPLTPAATAYAYGGGGAQ
jgi:hypothetical protein